MCECCKTVRRVAELKVGDVVLDNVGEDIGFAQTVIGVGRTRYHFRNRICKSYWQPKKDIHYFLRIGWLAVQEKAA